MFGQVIQTQLPKKLNFRYQFFVAFLQSTSSLKQFEKKDEPHCSSDIIDSYYIIDSERSCYLNVVKAMLQDSLGHSMC